MDKKKQSILKQEGRIPLQEVGLPDFPDDDTTTATVTKSRRVSFGANFVKEFIKGSVVSTQFYSEYEQAFSSSDSSNLNSSRSGLLDHSTFNQEINALDLCISKSNSDKENKPLNQTFCNEKQKCERKETNDKGDDEHWEFSVGSGSDIFSSKNMNQSLRAETIKNGTKCGKKVAHVEDSFAEKVSHGKRSDHELTHQKLNDTFEKKTKHGKFSSTICFSADSPTADMEFTEGCISLAKSILDKKKQEMTVYIEAKPKENNREEKKEENNTIHFDASGVEMSLTKCVPNDSFSDSSEFETDEEVPKPFQANVSMDTSDSSEGPGEEPQRLYPLDIILGRGADSEDDGDLIRSLFHPERSLTEMLNAKSVKSPPCADGGTEDDNEECDMEVTDVGVPCIIKTDSSEFAEPAVEVEVDDEVPMENLISDLVLGADGDDTDAEQSQSHSQSLSPLTENCKQIEAPFSEEEVDVEKSSLLPNGSSFDPPAASTCHNPMAMLKRKNLCEETPTDDAEIRSFTLGTPLLENSTEGSSNAAENSLAVESQSWDSRWETEDCPRTTKRLRQSSYPSAGDEKIILLLKEQSEEANCCWEIGGFTYEGSSPCWLFNLNMLGMVAEMKFELKLPRDTSLVSFSSIAKAGIELREEGLERKAEVDFAFKKLKKHFAVESGVVETVHKMPFFLDKMNLFASKTRALMTQLQRITKEYPGSRLKGSSLSFRLYSFPLLFSCLISVEISDSLLLAESSVSVRRHFGRFSETQARALFEECLKTDDVLVSYVRSLNQFVVGLERDTGRVTDRTHVRLLK